MLSITENTSREVWRPVNLKDHGKFEILLRKPTWEQLTEDSRREPGHLEKRLRETVIGWSEISINGEFPEFSWSAFTKLCEAVPAVFHIVSALVSDLYYSLGEDAEKNSEGASSTS